jgi:hypothetical protein
MALVAAYELDIRNWKRPQQKPKQIIAKRTPLTHKSTPLPGYGTRPDWFNTRR